MLDALAYRGYRISLCHGWSAGPAAWLSAEVLGVRPVQPGFGEIEIVPHLCDLEWAEGSVPTPRGNVDVRHERKGKRCESRIAVPEGTVAWFGIEKARDAEPRIEVNGRSRLPDKQEEHVAYIRLAGGRTHTVATALE
jgi:hypothetical protein